jgi:CHAT domain-containing protein
MRVSWRTRPPAKFWEDGLEALQQIERLRQEQGTASRAGSFSTWSDDYYWLAGRLLQPPGGGEGGIDHAFAVAEHLRARTLLEALAGAGAEPPSPEQLASRLRSILLASGEVRRRAADRNVPARERRYAQEDLAELARRRAEVERQRKHPAPAPLAQPFSSLSEVRAALAPDEALLSFQVAPQKDWTGAFGGGSWLTVVTHGAPPRAYHLPGREDLRDRVSQLITPLESDSQDPQQDKKCAALYGQLLAPALHELPTGVRRLTIVPDDDLYRLPWAALRPKAGEKRLGELYEISIAPSSTLLLKWRREPSQPASMPALVISAPLAGPALPRARAEGERIVLSIPGSRPLTGAQASEAAVKHTRLSDYGILHLAAHSVIDLDNPELSAVRLSPGKGEDGQLRFSEILGLRLDGRLVVLSSCETASGQILRGEGPMSLARAFFQARAHAVVASLWPIEDADAKALFERFYRHLGARESVASALRAAQRELIAEGAPAARWAGFEVIGDGNLLPVGAPKRPATPPR